MRLVMAYGVTVFLAEIMPSEWLAHLTGKPAAVATKLEGYPPAILAFLLVGFVFLNRKYFVSAETKLPSLLNVLIALLTFGVALLFTFNLTHPPYNLLLKQVETANQSPLFYAPLLGSTYTSVLYIPFLPAIALVFPFAFLKRYGWQFGVILLIVLASIFSTFLEARYHFFVFGSTLELVQWLLELFGQNVTADYQTMEMSNDLFSVSIGPACSGFRFAILFTLLYVVTWIPLARKAKCRNGARSVANIHLDFLKSETCNFQNRPNVLSFRLTMKSHYRLNRIIWLRNNKTNFGNACILE
ncbi:MAG: hypothetical protein QM501_14775 [Gimesia sp.]